MLGLGRFHRLHQPGPPRATPAANDAFTGLGNSPLNVTAAQGVLINDPAPAPVTQFQNPSAQGGMVNINADGSLGYTPPAGFVGQDTFTYTITNQAGQSQATVTVTINNLAFYVNNTAGGGGNGTFAAPFNTLAAAVAAAGPGNIIFVFRGDGTNNGLAGPIVLQDGQSLIGEGAGLNFNNGINPRAEDILAQQIVPPGQFPVVPGPVTLADGNLVTGIRFENTVGNAITGTGIDGTSIVANQIISPTIGGVVLVNSTGILRLSGNQVSGTGDIGFNFNFDGGNPTLVVQDNQFTDTGNAGLRTLPTGTANVTATFTGNRVTNSGVGGGGFDFFPEQNSVLNLTLTNNTVDTSTAVGFGILTFDNAQVTASILNNTSTGAALQGLVIGSENNTQVAAEIRGNQLTGNGPDFGFEARTFDAATHCLAITGNSTDRFVFRQFDTSVLRVENFANLQAINTAGTVSVEQGTVTGVAAGFCGF